MLITSTCILLLIAVIVVVYLKMWVVHSSLPGSISIHPPSTDVMSNSLTLSLTKHLSIFTSSTSDYLTVPKPYILAGLTAYFPIHVFAAFVSTHFISSFSSLVCGSIYEVNIQSILGWFTVVINIGEWYCMLVDGIFMSLCLISYVQCHSLATGKKPALGA